MLMPRLLERHSIEKLSSMNFRLSFVSSQKHSFLVSDWYIQQLFVSFECRWQSARELGAEEFPHGREIGRIVRSLMSRYGEYMFFISGL